jgi:hypothetical protein
MDVHGGLAAGEFQLFKHAPLAARSGRYQSYDSPPDQYHRHCVSTNVVLFTDPARSDDRGDQNTRRGLKTDHKTWDDWLAIRERNRHDVATITDWEAGDGLARCRADLSRANPPEKCRQWIREFVWLAGRHLVVLDVVEAATPAIRRQWQLHAPAEPKIDGRLLTIVNAPPARKWSDASLQPPRTEGRLFCRTLAPEEYTLILHGGGKVRAVDPAGEPRSDVKGNPHHLKYGKHVLQVDPGAASTRTVFLHVLTAVDAPDAAPPEAGFRLVRPGRIEVTVDGRKAALEVPAWFKG